MGEMKQCLQFIEKSPSSFHAVRNLEQMLQEAGFTPLSEQEPWELKAGSSYYVTRNHSALIAFSLPADQKPCGFHMVAAHSDSPSFKLKTMPELGDANYVRLNTERYGGMILSSWFDRPLSVAGRVVIEQDGELVEKLIDVDRDLCVIPSVAIHMNREINKGVEYNAQTDLLPLFGEGADKGAFENLIAQEAGVLKEQILGTELYLYTRQKGCFLGAKEEFVLSPRLDDLECAYGAVRSLIGAKPTKHIPVAVVFDNEEVGSQTRQGAGSTFLKDTLYHMVDVLSVSGGLETVDGESTETVWMRLLADSFLISADNAHARHPNHPEKADPVNAPVLNGGIVLKYHGGQKYMTDAVSEAILKKLCREAEVPVQSYTNRSDIPGGSTLGNIAVTQVPVRGVDIGLPQLSMHSAVETAGSRDLEGLEKLAKHFYEV